MGSYKTSKNLLRELGFHHSWGYYIHKSNSQYRVSFTKNTMKMTTRGNEFYYKDVINFRQLEMYEIQKRLAEFFGIKLIFKYGK